MADDTEEEDEDDNVDPHQGHKMRSDQESGHGAAAFACEMDLGIHRDDAKLLFLAKEAHPDSHHPYSIQAAEHLQALADRLEAEMAANH